MSLRWCRWATAGLIVPWLVGCDPGIADPSRDAPVEPGPVLLDAVFASNANPTVSYRLELLASRPTREFPAMTRQRAVTVEYANDENGEGPEIRHHFPEPDLPFGPEHPPAFDIAMVTYRPGEFSMWDRNGERLSPPDGSLELTGDRTTSTGDALLTVAGSARTLDDPEPEATSAGSRAERRRARLRPDPASGGDLLRALREELEEIGQDANVIRFAQDRGTDRLELTFDQRVQAVVMSEHFSSGTLVARTIHQYGPVPGGGYALDRVETSLYAPDGSVRSTVRQIVEAIHLPDMEGGS